MKLMIPTCLILTLSTIVPVANAGLFDGLFSNSRNVYVNSFSVKNDFDVTDSSGHRLEFKTSPAANNSYQYTGIPGVTHTSDRTLCEGSEESSEFKQLMLKSSVMIIAANLQIDGRAKLTQSEIETLSNTPECEPFTYALALIENSVKNISTPDAPKINNPKASYVRFKKNRLIIEMENKKKVTFNLGRKYKLDSEGVPRDFDGVSPHLQQPKT